MVRWMIFILLNLRILLIYFRQMNKKSTINKNNRQHVYIVDSNKIMSKVWVDISYHHHQIIVYRLNDGVIGELRGNGLKIAKEMINNCGCGNGALNPGFYNEIEIESKDFVPY